MSGFDMLAIMGFGYAGNDGVDLIVLHPGPDRVGHHGWQTVYEF